MSQHLAAGRFDLVFAATGETVVDVEALARGAMHAERWPIDLEEADNAELLATLLGDAVLLERQYQRRVGIEARPWLFQRLRWKARDWREAFYGRVGQHRTLGSIDGASLSNAGDYGAEELGGYGLADRLAGVGGGGSVGEPSCPPPGDRGDDGLHVLGRLLEDGDRDLLREIEALGLGPPPGARGRTSRARRDFARLDRLRRARVAALERREREQVAAA